MADHSAIEWTDATWNPVRGCVKVSPGCAHCYAETFAERFRGVKGHPYEQGFDLRLVPEQLAAPLSWKKPRRVFVNSMSDLFQDGVPDEYIDRVFAVMALAPQHTFQVLTKRAERMRAYLASDNRAGFIAGAQTHPPIGLAEFEIRFPVWPLPNVWLGVSVENQHFANERIPLLLQTPAAVRFISAEPLLGPLELAWEGYGPYEYGYLREGLDWVIVGGESGHGARPFAHDWCRAIIAQCKATGVACFVKQLGSHHYPIYITDKDGVFLGGTTDLSGRRRKGGDLTEWPADLRVREWPAR
jgi:protein gp37